MKNEKQGFVIILICKDESKKGLSENPETVSVKDPGFVDLRLFARAENQSGMPLVACGKRINRGWIDPEYFGKIQPNGEAPAKPVGQNQEDFKRKK